MEEINQLILSNHARLQRDLEDIRILPNPASRGYEAEVVLKKILRRYLPNKYAIGGGYIYCGTRWSHQHDIIIYDHLLNTPIYQGDVNSLYSVGSVYGVIESSMAELTRKKLSEDVAKLADLRKIIPHEKIKFLRPIVKKTEAGHYVSDSEIFSSGPPPRTYMIYTSGTTYSNIEDLAADLRKIATEAQGHIHGLLVLDSPLSTKIPLGKEWYIRMKPYAGGETEVTDTEGFYNFIQGMRSAFEGLKVGKYQAYDYHEQASRVDVS